MNEGTLGPGGWSPRARLFVVGWLFLQIGLPLIARVLAHQHGTYIVMGWQMFARAHGDF